MNQAVGPRRGEEAVPEPQHVPSLPGEAAQHVPAHSVPRNLAKGTRQQLRKARTLLRRCEGH